jgi:hypothetical protein
MFLARCAQSANFLATRLHRFKLRARPNGARGFLMRVNPYGTVAPNTKNRSKSRPRWAASRFVRGE